MASTRNLNTKGDYACEKQKDKHVQDYLLYNGFANAPNPVLFSFGSNPNMYGGMFSQNSIDIESKLRGIRSTNLEGPSFNPSPQFKSIPTTCYFERPKLIMPSPFFHSLSERPNYLS